jgi:hypothetical protein
MKRAVSVSLGSPTRDKTVVVDFNGTPVEIKRIGTGGNAEQARRLFTELDGKVDALSVGGIDLYVRIDGRDYPVRNALKLVTGVQHTPLIDGRMLKYVLERRVTALANTQLQESGFAPLAGFKRAFMPFSVDRLGLAEAVSQIADEVVFGDLVFALGIPLPIRGLTSFKRVAKSLMPLMGFLPLSMLFPPGARDEAPHPKHAQLWLTADLIAGDLHYIRKYAPAKLPGRVVITNTTTPENIAMLRQKEVHLVITTTPRYDGRSFGVNMMEAALTAYAGRNRPLDENELDLLVSELNLRPYIERLNPHSPASAS